MLDKFNKFNNIREKQKEIQKEVKERTLGYVTAALGLVAGLAWNDAVKALIEYLFPLSKNTLAAKFIYASLVTMIVVVMTIILVRFIGRSQEKK